MSAAATLRSFRRFARGMVVVAICLSLGLQWAALQGVAWTGMLISFSQSGSLLEAVEKTFDGEHPCPLCKAVEKGKKQDQSGEVKNPLKKMDALVVQVVSLIAPAGEQLSYPALHEHSARRQAAPPAKPPRALSA